jgi:hypothetical protein
MLHHTEGHLAPASLAPFSLNHNTWTGLEHANMLTGLCNFLPKLRMFRCR